MGKGQKRLKRAKKKFKVLFEWSLKYLGLRTIVRKIFGNDITSLKI